MCTTEIYNGDTYSQGIHTDGSCIRRGAPTLAGFVDCGAYEDGGYQRYWTDSRSCNGGTTLAVNYIALYCHTTA